MAAVHLYYYGLVGLNQPITLETLQLAHQIGLWSIQDCLLDHIAVSCHGTGQPWSRSVADQVRDEAQRASTERSNSTDLMLPACHPLAKWEHPIGCSGTRSPPKAIHESGRTASGGSGEHRVDGYSVLSGARRGSIALPRQAIAAE